MHGAHRFQLECSGWHATGNWTKDVTAAEVAALERAFADAALAAQEGQPPSVDGSTGAGWSA
ncbi:hypothetical protein [Streptomyces sp. NPDC058622]|uniref:hypothetical protein n=1 Tax=Streptomyces sp. NPDC058622 TaxID=3346562 RepID=UPI00365FCD4F